MGTTRNFYVADHKNKGDKDFQLIAWFEKNQDISTNSRYERGVFRIKDYEISIELRQSTLLCIKSSCVLHDTRGNKNYTQLGIVLVVNSSVFTFAQKEIEKYEFSNVHGIIELEDDKVYVPNWVNFDL